MDKLQVFSEKLNSSIMIGTASVGKDIVINTYNASWIDGGWNATSGWIDGGWNATSGWIDGGWNATSGWIDGGWNATSGWIDGGWNATSDWNASSGGGGWDNFSGGGGGGRRRRGLGDIIRGLKVAVLAFLILIGGALLIMAINGNLDIKFLRGSDYIGEWNFDSLHYTSDGIIYQAEDDYAFLCNYVIRKDGTFDIELNGENASGTWTKEEIDSLTGLVLTYEEGTSSEIESLIQDDVIYYIRTDNMAELYKHKGDMFFLLDGYDSEEAVYIVFSK